MISSILINKVNKKTIKNMYPLISIILLILNIVNYECLINTIAAIYIESDGGRASDLLYRSAFKKSMKSVLLGYEQEKYIPWAEGKVLILIFSRYYYKVELLDQ